MTALITSTPKTRLQMLKERALNITRQTVQLVKNIVPATEKYIQNSVTLSVKKRQIKEIVSKIKSSPIPAKIIKSVGAFIERHIVIIACLSILLNIHTVLAWLGTWTVIATGLPVFPMFA